MIDVSFRGTGLFTGLDVGVRAERRAGIPISWGAVPRRAFDVTAAPRTTCIQAAGCRLFCVEHFFAALAALGIHQGLAFVTDGPELPLLDGGAATFIAGLRRLDVPKSPPPLRIATDGVVRVGLTELRFSRGEAACVRAIVEFGDPRLGRAAEWLGDDACFEADIAPARPFVFARELAAIAEAKVRFHVDPSSAVVIGDDGVFSEGRGFAWDEPVRHKLLDLIGDLFAWGGPPAGTVEAYRPGHASTHAAVERALERGILERDA